jgi:hypothetical protein
MLERKKTYHGNYLTYHGGGRYRLFFRWSKQRLPDTGEGVDPEKKSFSLVNE